MSYIGSHFTHEYRISRLVESPSFGAETYETVGTVRGYLQYRGGSLDVDNGAVVGNEAAVLYCPVGEFPRPGDLVTDVYGKVYRARSSQEHGIVGRGSHMEVTLEFVNYGD